MKATRLYANVLVDVAAAPGTQGTLESLIAELNSFSVAIGENATFGKVFENPVFGEDEKQKILNELVKKAGLSALAVRFLNLLSKRNRLALLPAILQEIQVISVERKGGLIGEIVSAVPIDESTIAGISGAIGKRLNKPVQLKSRVDQSLIAGMRVTVSGVTYDGSVQAKFAKLSESI